MRPAGRRERPAGVKGDRPQMQTVSAPEKFIRDYDGPQIRIMEVCGTHTHAICRLGIRGLLPENVSLISGPGCPVCVTPAGYIDQAVELALSRGVTVCTFGDLMRVPGSEMSLAQARARGAKTRIVYAPDDAVAFAAEHPDEPVVFLSVGFETTTPASCLAVRHAAREDVRNFAILTANKTMENAYRLLAPSADAFLYPGHVSAITGTGIYRLLLREGISGAVAGFASSEILLAIATILRQHRLGKPFAVNCYPRVVTEEGMPAAKALMAEMMEPCDAAWRGLGVIRASGLRLRPAYEGYDARKKYALHVSDGRDHPLCRCGDVLSGRCSPDACSLFGKGCTPAHPVGACMVSSEGACSAYYQYGGTAVWKKS